MSNVFDFLVQATSLEDFDRRVQRLNQQQRYMNSGFIHNWRQVFTTTYEDYDLDSVSWGSMVVDHDQKGRPLTEQDLGLDHVSRRKRRVK